jgi:exodeoxyribonuclease VIII
MCAGAFVPGVYDAYTNAEYHAADGVSKSDLDLIHKSPAHYKAARHEDTPALRFGTAFHCAVLENDRFNETYTIIEGDRRTKAVKDAIKDAEAAGKIILTHDDFNALMGMSQAVFKNPICAALLRGSRKEHSVFSELDGVRVKCRPDGWNTEKGVLFDLKSAEDASPEGFARTVAKWRYHVQDAFYRHVVASARSCDADDLSFIFVAVEKKPPFAVALYQLDELAALQGWVDAREDLRRYKTAKDTGKWGGYSPRIETLSLPRWAVSNSE